MLSNIGVFNLGIYLDDDGHLNIFIKSKDESEIIEVESDISGSDNEVSLRFTTSSIEDKYLETL